MLGLIAIVVFVHKRKKLPAVLAGVWTVISAFFVLKGQYAALIPGLGFVIAAFAVKETVSEEYREYICYCPNCGYVFGQIWNDYSLLCPECGAPLYLSNVRKEEWQRLSVTEKEQTAENWRLDMLENRKNKQGTAPAQEAASVPQQAHTEAAAALSLPAQISPTLRRAFLFLEDAEWEKAEAYLDKELDAFPESAYAYVGKLMLEYRIREPGGIAEIENARDSGNFRKAYRFGDDSLKSYLSNCL